MVEEVRGAGGECPVEGSLCVSDAEPQDEALHTDADQLQGLLLWVQVRANETTGYRSPHVGQVYGSGNMAS